MVDKYLYRKNRGSYWRCIRCTKYKCRSRLILKAGCAPKSIEKHTHGPETEKISWGRSLLSNNLELSKENERRIKISNRQPHCKVDYVLPNEKKLRNITKRKKSKKEISDEDDDEDDDDDNDVEDDADIHDVNEEEDDEDDMVEIKEFESAKANDADSSISSSKEKKLIVKNPVPRKKLISPKRIVAMIKNEKTNPITIITTTSAKNPISEKKKN